MTNIAKARNYLYEMMGYGYCRLDFEQFKEELNLTDTRGRLYCEQLRKAGVIEKIWMGKIYINGAKTPQKKTTNS
jgi:hypothetical protein